MRGSASSHCATATAPASTPSATASVRQLTFFVSRDEEHVEIELALGSGARVRPKPRAHLYLLLTLARQRLADRDQVPPSEEGWVHQEDLRRMLKLSDNVLYTQIFRARRQLVAAGVATADEVIERRPGTGLMRLGIRAIEVR